MSGILDKLCWGRAIGAYFNGDRVNITDTGNTIKGPTVLNQQSFEVADKDSIGALTSVLQEYVKNHGGKNVPICFGLKPEQAFFITSGADYGQDDKLRDKLLDSAGFRGAEERKEVVTDYFKINKVKSPAGQLWSIGICRKQVAQELYTAIEKAGFKHFTLKPTPWAMSAFSTKLPKKAKGWKVFIQVFLSKTGGLAVLVVEKHPMCWKRFAFSQSKPIDKIESAIRGILIQSTIALARPVIDGIVLEGTDAENLSQMLYDRFAIETATASSDEYTDLHCSESLAISAKSKEETQFDLFQELRPKPSIKQIFPWKIAAVIMLLAGGMGFLMWQKVSELASNYKNIKKQNSAYAWAVSQNTGEIAKIRKELLAETEAVGKFLSTRIVWSDYLRDLPTRLPSNVSFSDVLAVCEYLEAKKKDDGARKRERSLMLRGATLFENGRASPEEIEAFMDSLRKVELLKRDFPKVELTEIKWRRQGDSETAMFTVTASPNKSSKKGD
jgi:Tfp pilus assembly protein PilN